MDLFSKLGDMFRPTDLSKGKDNEQSKEAFKRVEVQKMRSKVLELIDGKRSTIEISKLLETDLHKISGRFTELKLTNHIEKVGVKDGFTIYAKTRF